MAISASGIELPLPIRAVCDELKRGIKEAWDAHANMDREKVLDSPLGKLVSAFGDCGAGNQTYRRLAWLLFFVVRRSLDCWEHHRAEPKPFEAVAFLGGWIAAGMTPPRNALPTLFGRMRDAVGRSSDPWKEFAKPGKPRFHEPKDCCYGEWACAASAVAYAMRFPVSADPFHAIFGLSDADSAHDECGIHGEGFRHWFINYAIPIAWAQREMTHEEQDVFKNYDQEKIRQWRESGRGT